VRVGLLSAPPSADAGEITDKGYVNARAVCDRRPEALEGLYAAARGEAVLVLGVD
jgi:feruloyl-CoA synthase